MHSPTIVGHVVNFKICRFGTPGGRKLIVPIKLAVFRGLRKSVNILCDLCLPLFHFCAKHIEMIENTRRIGL